MKQQIRGEERSRVEAVNLVVDHPGQPGQRVPVGQIEVRKGPANAVARKSETDIRVVPDVDEVVPIDPLVIAEFDLFTVGLEGGEPVRVTYAPGFDSFPMFSPDGRWLVFASNRAGPAGETNLFIARWVGSTE